MVKPTEYELERLEKIARNKKLLESLGLGTPSEWFPKAATNGKGRTTKSKNATTKKRKAPQEEDEYDDKENEDAEGEANESVEEGEENSVKKKKTRRRTDNVATVEGDNTPLRRSQRNAGKTIDYNGEKDRSVRTVTVRTNSKVAMGSEPRLANKRMHDPKQYGHIAGVPVGSWWETREACSIDAIHAPWVGGISVGPKGAYSVALSGGYDDDVDLGYGFTYTGSGGRDLKGTKDKPKNLRTAPQSSDQTFENNFNHALQKSAQTRMPVRVIRGFKLQSPWAPAEGYRYDGLYRVEKAWQEPGLNEKGYLVCKFAFKRLTDQPPLEMEAETEAEEDDAEGENVDVNGVADTNEDVESAEGDLDAEAENEDDN